MRNEDLMIDLETLGTSADAVIMSIGAVRFDIDSDSMDDNAFYASVSIDSNLASGRHISADTLIWWLKQSSEAQKVFFESKVDLHHALGDLSAWIADICPVRSVWSNGADFDIPMLTHAFASFDMALPWRHWNSRCVRTYKNLPMARNVVIENSVKHNALSDAIHQTKLVQAIHKKLIASHPMVKAS